MDPKTYIESGILEDYILGFASEQERQEVACLSKIYPEIAQALQEIEDATFLMAENNAVAPPAGTKEAIMANLGEQEAVMSKVEDAAPESIEINKESSPTKKLEDAKNGLSPVWLAAASLIIAVGFAYQWYSASQSAQELENSVANQEAELISVKSQLEATANDKDYYQSLWADVAKPETQKVKLNSVQEGQEALATVFWNPAEQKTYFYRNNLPAEGQGQQYQLWAIVEGQPVSLGLLALTGQKLELQNMEAVANAAAFAITLEPEGGSENPTLENMIVLGEI